MDQRRTQTRILNKLSCTLLCLFCFFTVFPAGNQVVECSSAHNRHRLRRGLLSTTKLFVFGDSYVDTGNSNVRTSNSWVVPFGVTFPGKPTGRFSDGRVLPDYIASYLGIQSPIPYQWRYTDVEHLQYGMNFAYGGTGVFDTLVPEPNMTTQIDFLEKVIQNGIYTEPDLISSVALVSAAGNDYGTYLVKHGTVEGLPAFIAAVVNQLALNLKRIHGLGIRKIAVSSLGPVGCLPANTAMSSHQQCNETLNIPAIMHNSLLQQAVEELKNHAGGGDGDSEFVVLDMYNSFMAAFKSPGDKPGSMKFENPLKPCCVGTNAGYYCGSVDKRTGAKKYVLCENPEKAFFWDDVHPTQQAWHSVFLALQPSLHRLYSKT